MTSFKIDLSIRSYINFIPYSLRKLKIYHLLGLFLIISGLFYIEKKITIKVIRLQVDFDLKDNFKYVQDQNEFYSEFLNRVIQNRNNYYSTCYATKLKHFRKRDTIIVKSEYNSIIFEKRNLNLIDYKHFKKCIDR